MPDRPRQRVPFSDLATAAYCPRQLYYARREADRSVPERVAAVRELAFEYPALVEAPDAAIRDRPVEVPAAEYRRRLRALRDEGWGSLVSPAERAVTVAGRDVVGRVDKVVTAPLRPSLVSPGHPPPEGVWEPQSVRAVAAAKALSYREGTTVDRAVVEYPAHGVVRTLSLTTRRKAAYRRALRTVRDLDGPPPRLADDAKCAPCDYSADCGVQTRSLRSLL
ncbi:MAG: hypothetical protein ABEJ70_09505 [Halobacteriaceae archaeon]